MRKLSVLFAFVAAAAFASAATIEAYSTTIAPVNGSGVTGTALFTFTDDTSLTVQINAAGLQAGDHPAHLHGLVGPGGTLLPPSVPTDMDGDHYIETPEAAPAIGPPLIDLGTFTVGPNGILNATHTYNLAASSTFQAGFSAANLYPRNFLTFEIHGMTVPQGAGAGTPYEVNGSGGYIAILPVGSGQLSPASTVPEPATYGVCGAALALLAGVRRRMQK